MEIFMKSTAKIAIASPKIKLCIPDHNADVCISLARQADAAGADIIVFPELTLTGATAGDLFMQKLLLTAAEDALAKYIEETKELSVMSFIGLPIVAEDEIFGDVIYNAVAAVSEGELLGISVSGLSDDVFSPAPEGDVTTVVAGREVILSRSHIYTDEATRSSIFVKIGDDNAYVKDAANIILNPTATAEYTTLAKHRREFAKRVSEATDTFFVMAGAGEGESGTDGVYASARLCASSGRLVFEAPLFDERVFYVEASCDEDITPCREIEPEDPRFPFIPTDKEERRVACELGLVLQARALSARMERAYADRAVIGISGGLDSTLALLAAAEAMDVLGRSRENIIAITMPCFGTTERTKSNAILLAEGLGCTVRTIDIKAAVAQHFKDISHDENNYNVVYENSPARERTQILMDVANAENGLVIGTGDLSELALGFATYNGDHMSMYAVNASIPKTLMRAMIADCADKLSGEGREDMAKILLDVINTPVSPELLPSDGKENSQHTEGIVGPYELHDFFLYHLVKYGMTPSEILEECKRAFTEYAEEEIEVYLDVFVRKFFSQQFKRSCLPDGPRVTEISLSPRGAWRMPSDVSGKLWRDDIKKR